MKIGVYSIPQIPLGKHNLKDSRLDQLDQINKANKKTYIQLELTGKDNLLDVEAILVLKDSAADLILKDLEFIETRLGRSEQETEKALLNKLKNILEKEEFLSKACLSDGERQAISGYGLCTNKPIVVAEKADLADWDNLLAKAITASDFISFFTCNERETRAWLIKKGTTAYEAAGLIHSDIQRGFIRAEVIGFGDLIKSSSITQAKQQGKMRLEQKDYVIQDADLVNFRFNK